MTFSDEITEKKQPQSSSAQKDQRGPTGGWRSLTPAELLAVQKFSSSSSSKTEPKSNDHVPKWQNNLKSASSPRNGGRPTPSLSKQRRFEPNYKPASSPTNNGHLRLNHPPSRPSSPSNRRFVPNANSPTWKSLQAKKECRRVRAAATAAVAAAVHSRTRPILKAWRTATACFRVLKLWRNAIRPAAAL